MVSTVDNFFFAQFNDEKSSKLKSQIVEIEKSLLFLNR